MKRILTHFGAAAVFFWLIMLPAIDWFIYGPIQDNLHDVQRLVQEDLLEMDPYEQSLLGVKDRSTPVYIISRNNSAFYATIVPFATEYYVIYATPAAVKNVRISDGSETYKMLKQKHRQLIRNQSTTLVNR